MQPILAGLAAAAVLCGALLLTAGLVGTRRPAAPRSRLRRTAARVWLGKGISRAERRARQLVLLLALAATVGAWLWTRIPIAGLIAGVTVIGVPWLFTAGRAEQRAIDQLEALEIWTRRLTDSVRTGLGLNQAIIVSTRDVPAPIEPDLRELEAHLRAGVPTLLALDRFAEALSDASSDEVIMALRQHATDRGQRLADILDKIAAKIADEVQMRREVWATRADPRLTTKFMTVLSVVTFVFLFSNTEWVRPYGTFVGQMVLTVCFVVFLFLLAWIRQLSQPRRIPRLLQPSTPIEEPSG